MSAITTLGYHSLLTMNKGERGRYEDPSPTQSASESEISSIESSSTSPYPPSTSRSTTVSPFQLVSPPVEMEITQYFLVTPNPQYFLVPPSPKRVFCTL